MALQASPQGRRGRRLPRGVIIAFKAAAALHRLAGGAGMGRMLLLTTIGRKSGHERTVQLSWFEDAVNVPGRWLVVASRGGDRRHPDWFLNLVDRPEQVWVQLAARRVRVRVEVLQGAEREAAWARITSKHGNYAEYAKKTDRLIPVLRLCSVEMVQQPQWRAERVEGAMAPEAS